MHKAPWQVGVLTLLAAVATPQAYAAPALEEVTVTAQRRSESLQDVSVSVKVMSGDKLAQADIGSLEEMSHYVPTYHQGRTVLGSEARIRGIGSASNPGFEQSVGMFIDDIYMGRSQQTTQPLFDLDRIEVLKGPQSTLFGKNTIAGAISMHSAAPTDALEGSVTALYGTDGQSKFAANISGPLSDALAGRLALVTRSHDGYIENSVSNNDGPANDQWGARGILRWDAGDALSMRLKVERSQDKTDGAPQVLLLNTTLQGPGAPPLFSHLQEVPPHYLGVDDSDPFKTSVGNTVDGKFHDWQTKTDFTNALYQLEYQLDEHLLTSITGYTQFTAKDLKDLDISPVTLISADAEEDFEQWSQDVRLTSPLGGKLDYMAGVYVQQSKFVAGPSEVFFNLRNIGLPALADGYRFTHFDQEAQTLSAFVHGNWHITEQFTLKLGLRYTREDKELNKVLELADADRRVLIPGTADDLVLGLFWRETQNAVPYSTNQHRSENQLSPSITLEWYPDADTLFYASASRGFKSGGWDNIHVNGDDLSTLEYGDETIEALEIGVKATLFDQRAEINAALFHSTIDNLQVSQFDGAVGFNVSNAAKATSMGLELDGRFALTEQLFGFASLAWLDYSYDEYADAPCNQRQANEFWRDTGTINGCSQDLQGESAIQAPEWSGTLGLSYELPLGDYLALDAALDANYRGEHEMAADLDPNVQQKATWLLNMQLGLADPAGSWRVSFIGKNLTDETHYTFADDAPLGNGTFYGVDDDTGSFVAITAPPRSFAVEATWYFQ